MLTEIEEAEVYLELAVQEGCRALPGHLDLGEEESLFLASRQEGFAQNFSARNEKGSWVSTGSHSSSLCGIQTVNVLRAELCHLSWSLQHMVFNKEP